MPSRKLDDLDPHFLPLACVFLARLVEARIPVVIIGTRRTQAEQDALVAAGYSWVPRSKHQDGLAIDVCPIEQFTLHGSMKLEWDADDPAWQTIGAAAEKLGLRWGGRFGPPARPDLGHVEMVRVGT